MQIDDMNELEYNMKRTYMNKLQHHDIITV